MRPCKRVLIFFMAFNGVRIVFESCPNRVRIVSESCKTMYGLINERTIERNERTIERNGRTNKTNGRNENNVSMQTKKGGYGKIHLPHPLLLYKKTEER